MQQHGLLWSMPVRVRWVGAEQAAPQQPGRGRHGPQECFLYGHPGGCFCEVVSEGLGTIHGLYTAPPLYRRKTAISPPLTAEDTGLSDVISDAC